MTRKLFEENVYLKEFTAQVISCEKVAAGYEVVLDQTAFFPEGGGQMSDRGTLGAANVLHVSLKGETILHLCDAPLEPGSKVTGVLDYDHRFDMMQQHSGEHIFSGILCRTFGCDNVGFHISKEELTVDFNRMFTPEEIQQAELAANQIIWKNEPIRAFYPDEEELKTLSYRSKKEIDGALRIVIIPNADVCACCGTHVSHTGEIGVIIVLSAMNYKGGTRLTLLCGQRAFREFEGKTRREREIAKLLSVKTEETIDAVLKLRQDRDNARKACEGLVGEEIIRLQQCADPAQPLVVASENMTSAQMKKLCMSLTQQYETAAGVTRDNDQLFFVLASDKRDVRPVCRELAERFAGKGGGQAALCQGKLSRGSIKEIEATLKALLTQA